jgi:hypothetical protein
MPIQVDWYDDSKQIVLCRIESDIIANELPQAHQAIEDFTRGLQHKIGVIWDYGNTLTNLGSGRIRPVVRGDFAVSFNRDENARHSPIVISVLIVPHDMIVAMTTLSEKILRAVPAALTGNNHIELVSNHDEAKSKILDYLAIQGST